MREAFLAYKRADLPHPYRDLLPSAVSGKGSVFQPNFLPLMAVLPLNEVWVDAISREVQLRNMRISHSPVKLVADVCSA
jgi:multidrug resistance efflux pump